ncbi:hypothetical protein CYMTET_17084 [Cymbomonas tetramitiformis]|uniref:Uncharacterized protein n=1 Tax=Cymbomonas tetramitiformis TaxID=36881 RepID=A0AAE0GBB9_9CHLO|nr:hypothetical protein CYMTET_17084 [Cymbomonas tetramitiformis]
MRAIEERPESFQTPRTPKDLRLLQQDSPRLSEFHSRSTWEPSNAFHGQPPHHTARPLQDVRRVADTNWLTDN